MTPEQIAHRDEVVKKLMGALRLFGALAPVGSPDAIEGAFKSIIAAEFYGPNSSLGNQKKP